MSPMTSNRAIGNIPNNLMAQYYARHASAGLIATEGTSPSPDGLGYARIAGIFSAGQIARWKAGATVNASNLSTCYTPGPKGYTYYPALTG